VGCNKPRSNFGNLIKETGILVFFSIVVFSLVLGFPTLLNLQMTSGSVFDVPIPQKIPILIFGGGIPLSWQEYYYFEKDLGIESFIQNAYGAEFYARQQDKIQVHLAGDTGLSTCPTAINTTAVDNTNPPEGFRWGKLTDNSGDPNGCYFSGWIWDETVVLPRFFDDLINNIFYAVDWGGTDWNSADNTGAGTGCRVVTLENTLASNDPRINSTYAYERIRITLGIQTSDLACVSTATETPYIQTVGVSTTDFTNRINDTYYFLGGKNGATGSVRDIGDRIVNLANGNFYLKYLIDMPVNHTSNWWQSQEHSLYGGTFPAITTGFFGNTSSTLTMHTGTTDAGKGQVVVFKQFNKTTLGTLDDIRVTGNLEAITSTSNVHVHIELRDGDFQAGQTENLPSSVSIGHDLNGYFPRGQFMKIIGGGLLGTVDFTPSSVGVSEPFDVSFIPNWDNSTNEIVTLMVGVRDNSATSRIEANVTSIEVENEVKYNFNDVNDLFFFQPDCSTTFATVTNIATNQNDQNCGLDNSNGLAQINTVALAGVTGVALPTPTAPSSVTATLTHFDTITVTWVHNGLNVTNWKIERNDGSGYETIAITDPLQTLSFIDVNQLNPDLARFNFKANATGLTENTSYTYRVSALNGDSSSSATTSNSVTTPDDDPYWELVEFNYESVPQFTPTTSGGDGDWFSVQSNVAGQGGAGGLLIKTFNLTHYNVTENNSDVQFYFDTDASTTPRDQHIVYFCNGDINRFNETIFLSDFSSNDCTAITNGLPHVWSLPAFDTGNLDTFAPFLKRMSLDWSLFDSGFMTVMFTNDDDSTLVRYNFDLKNFTLTNSTNWEMESATMTYTANNANCNANTFGFISSSDSCDNGSVLVTVTPTPNSETQQNAGTDDWQYREWEDQNSRFSFGSLFTNASGINILEDIAVAPATTGHPQEDGVFLVFKEFPSSVLTEPVSMWVQGEIGTQAQGISVGLTVFNGTIDRWLPNDFPLLYNFALYHPIVAQNVTGLSPFALQELTLDVTAPTESTVTIGTWIRDESSLRSGVVKIINATVGGTTYFFEGSSVTNEEISNTYGGDRGFVTPNSTSATVPDAVENLAGTYFSTTNATLDWDAPLDDGGSPITNYNVFSSINNVTFSSIGTPTLTAFTDTTPSATTMYYLINAENAVGSGTNSSLILVASIPDAITNLSVPPTGTTCNLSWTSPLNRGSAITGYNILRSVDGGSFITLVANTGNATPSYSDSGLQASSTYQYNVKAINSIGTASSSNIASCVPQSISPPNPPTNLTLQNQNDDVLLSWVAPASGTTPTGYKIERKVENGAFEILVSDTGNTNVTFLDTTIPALGTEVTYRITSLNTFGQSATTSNEETITTSNPPNMPTLMASQNGNQIDLSWTQPTSDGTINGYKIERRINGGSFSDLVSNTTTTNLTYNDLAVTKPNTYGYRVSALNDIPSTGTPSNIVDVVFGSHVTVMVREQDGSSYKGGGSVKAMNSTFDQTKTLSSLSNAVFDNLDSGNYNFTFIDLDDFILNKTINFPFPSGNSSSSFTVFALVFDVDCPINGQGSDVRIKVNYTNIQDITDFPSTPVCDSNDKVSWSTTWNGTAGTADSKMVADYISARFKANADNFIVGLIPTATTYDSFANRITSNTFAIITTSPTTQIFDLFLGEAPPSSSAPASSPSASSGSAGASIPANKIIFEDRLSGLTILSISHMFIKPNDVITGQITIGWNGEQEMIVKKIDVGEFTDLIRFTDTPTFTLDKRTEGAGETARSEATVGYTIYIPPAFCDEEQGILLNCLKKELITIPVTFTFEFQDQEFIGETEVILDAREIPVDIVQLQIIGLGLVVLISAFVGNSLRTRFNRDNKRRTKIKKRLTSS